jgi:hypothetical protein
MEPTGAAETRKAASRDRRRRTVRLKLPVMTVDANAFGFYEKDMSCAYRFPMTIAGSRGAAAGAEGMRVR